MTSSPTTTIVDEIVDDGRVAGDDVPPKPLWQQSKFVDNATGVVAILAAGSAVVSASYHPKEAAAIGCCVAGSAWLGAAAYGASPSSSVIKFLDTPKNALGAAVFLTTYIVPIVLAKIAVEAHGPPAFWQFLITFFEAFAIVGGCMSVCLHRYFAHQAFKTSRPMQCLVAIGGCHAWQGNPLWWASKHRRHHKHCDGPEDPHSWVQTNYLYAWVGWTLNPKEMAIDEEYVGSLGKFPELRVIGALWWVWPTLTSLAVYHYFGYYNMVLYCTSPMLLARLVTLIFNVEYHPPDMLESRLNPTDPAKKPSICLSLDMPRFLADCVGESCHDDHHAHPKRAMRPSGGFPNADLPFWAIIKPLEMLGLVWSLSD